MMPPSGERHVVFPGCPLSIEGYLPCHGGSIHSMHVMAPVTRHLLRRRQADRSWPGTLAGCAGLLVLAAFLARASLTWAVAGTGGIAFLLILAVEPVAGLAALALAIPIGGLLPLPVPGVNIVDLLVALTVVAWLARGIVHRQIIIRWPPLLWTVLVMVWIFALSLTQATSWQDGVPEWLKWAEFAALYLVASQVMGGRRTWWVIGALFLAGSAEAALGAYQFVRQIGPKEFILMGRFMRASGTFNQPNPYAGYLGYLTPVAASLALCGLGRWWMGRREAPAKPEQTETQRRWLTRDLWIGLLCGGVALALAAGLGMSWSRGAWLGLGAALVVVAGLRNRRTAVLTAGVVLALALVFVVGGTRWLPASIAARLSDVGGLTTSTDPVRTEITDENFAVLERLAHWRAGQAMFNDHPWLGVGIGNYGAAYAIYGLPHWYAALGHAHNVYINFLAETGILGGLSFGAFWLAAVWFVGRRGLRGAGYSAALAVGVLGTLTYCTVHNLFDNLFVAHMQLQLALLLAALAANDAKSHGRVEDTGVV
jgi:putative inorganic carbon (hco3(-)) transporter